MVYSPAMPTKRFLLSLPLAAALFAFSPSVSAEAPAEGEQSENRAEKKKLKQKLRKKAAGQGMGSKDGPVALFAGFRVLPDGSTRVFVDLSGRAPVTKLEKDGELVYILKGARLASANNKNALVTTHFNTPVSRARLVPVSEDIELVIELRAETTPSHRVLRRDGEAAQLQIDFPAGQFPSPKDEQKPAES